MKTCDELVIAFESSNNFGGLSSSTNCQLSNIPTKNLLSQDLISDSSWNIYEQLDDGNGGTCGDSIGGNICYVKERYGYRHFRQGFYSFLQNISFPYKCRFSFFSVNLWIEIKQPLALLLVFNKCFEFCELVMSQKYLGTIFLIDMILNAW